MIQEAGLYNVLRVILWLVLIYYAVKILSRIFAPLVIKSILKKAESKFGQGFNQQQQKTQHKKEGEISIDKMPQQKKSNDDIGEYVDYEEVD